ncbi:UNVERIFIED_CONTAM: hypothetical protein PYX00_004078 [Menopon gallinae]|uniref:5'-nucleotidase n=1 Tax=Menopon gallinae TaxID=328185 RepID=A0AAW2I4W8_9NEOP
MALLCSLRMAALTLVVAAAVSVPVEDTFPLRVIHTNDMHSRFEQISRLGGKCTEYDLKNNRCYGGFPRLVTAVKEQRRKAEEEKTPLLFLNAGDTYQGTVWYTVHKWKVVSALTNMLTIDAMSLGNHEFDDGVEGLIPFLNAAKFPVVTCNLGLEEEPELKATPLAPSVVFNVTGRRIGVIGYLTPETTALSFDGEGEDLQRDTQHNGRGEEDEGQRNRHNHRCRTFRVRDRSQNRQTSPVRGCRDRRSHQHVPLHRQSPRFGNSRQFVSRDCDSVIREKGRGRSSVRLHQVPGRSEPEIRQSRRADRGDRQSAVAELQSAGGPGDADRPGTVEGRGCEPDEEEAGKVEGVPRRRLQVLRVQSREPNHGRLHPLRCDEPHRFGMGEGSDSPAAGGGDPDVNRRRQKGWFCDHGGRNNHDAVLKYSGNIQH